MILIIITLMYIFINTFHHPFDPCMTDWLAMNGPNLYNSSICSDISFRYKDVNVLLTGPGACFHHLTDWNVIVKRC